MRRNSNNHRHNRNGAWRYPAFVSTAASIDQKTQMVSFVHYLYLVVVTCFFGVVRTFLPIHFQRLHRPALSARLPATQPHATQPHSLGDLIERLDEKLIRYPPTASRRELENLYELEMQRHSSIAGNTSSRGDRERMIQGQSNSSSYPFQEESKTIPVQAEKSDSDGVVVVEVVKMEHVEVPTTSATNKNSPEGTTEVPLAELLEQLDSVNIRYPPNASRKQLKALWRSRREEMIGPSVQTRTRKRLLRKQRVRRQRQVWQKVADQAVNVLETIPFQGTTDTVRRAARRVWRKSSDAWRVDENGVRDVDFSYLQQDTTVGLDNGKHEPQFAPIAKVYPSTRQVHSRRHGPWPSSSPRQQVRDSSTYYPRPRPQSRSYNRTKSMLLLPPAIGDRSVANSTSSPLKPHSVQSGSRPRAKRIYSPYATMDKRDEIDKFGDCVGDIAERILWGPGESFGSNATGTKSRNPSQKPRHWKDRMEERFDRLLGIHEDGEYYNSWTTKAKTLRSRGGGTDAFSVAQGMQPKSRGMAVGRKQYEKPIWEEEGNLVSLLLGRTPSDSSLFFEQALDRGHGSLLTVFRALFKTSLTLFSYLCRWASVRGAVPQPIVVMGVLSAAISARPRYRLRAVILCLIVLRTAGELIHGYVYGDSGWEDDEDAMDDNDGEERDELMEI